MKKDRRISAFADGDFACIGMFLRGEYVGTAQQCENEIEKKMREVIGNS